MPSAGPAGLHAKPVWPPSRHQAWKGRRQVTHLVQQAGFLDRGSAAPARGQRHHAGEQKNQTNFRTQDPVWSRQEVRSGRGTQGQQAGSEVRTPMPAQGEEGPPVIIIGTKDGFIKPETQGVAWTGEGTGCRKHQLR